MTGIFIEFHDHVSCDAFHVWVYRNGENLLTDEVLDLLTHNPYYKKDWKRDQGWFKGISITMVSDSAYYGTTGLKTAVRILKEQFPDLPVKCFKVGWYTFCGQWKDVGDYFQRCLSDVEMLEGTMKELEDSQK